MKELSNTFEEVRLVYRNKTKASERPLVNCAENAFQVLYKHWDHDQINLLEECKLLLLDSQMRLMSIASLSKGGTASTIVDPRIVFAIALKRRSHQIILGHNHPSGSLSPSRHDLKLTERISKLGELLDIQLADHLIITSEGYRSIMSDEMGGLSIE